MESLSSGTVSTAESATVDHDSCDEDGNESIDDSHATCLECTIESGPEAVKCTRKVT